MGWTSSTDTQSQVRLKFATKEEALEYASAHGIDAQVTEPKSRAANIRAGGYGENFATKPPQPLGRTERPARGRDPAMAVLR